MCDEITIGELCQLAAETLDEESILKTTSCGWLSLKCKFKSSIDAELVFSCS